MEPPPCSNVDLPWKPRLTPRSGVVAKTPLGLAVCGVLFDGQYQAYGDQFGAVACVPLPRTWTTVKRGGVAHLSERCLSMVGCQFRHGFVSRFV